MPLTVWDQKLGASREATQEDIDILQAKVNSYGRLINAFNETGDDMLVQVNTIQQRYRQSLNLSGDL